MSKITDSPDGSPEGPQGLSDAPLEHAAEPDLFRSMLRDGALAVGADPAYIDDVLAGRVCPACDLGLPGPHPAPCERAAAAGKDGER
jgi:hypothetical protein